MAVINGKGHFDAFTDNNTAYFSVRARYVQDESKLLQWWRIGKANNILQDLESFSSWAEECMMELRLKISAVCDSNSLYFQDNWNLAMRSSQVTANFATWG